MPRASQCLGPEMRRLQKEMFGAGHAPTRSPSAAKSAYYAPLPGSVSLRRRLSSHGSIDERPSQRARLAHKRAGGAVLPLITPQGPDFLAELQPPVPRQPEVLSVPQAFRTGGHSHLQGSQWIDMEERERPRFSASGIRALLGAPQDTQSAGETSSRDGTVSPPRQAVAQAMVPGCTEETHGAEPTRTPLPLAEDDGRLDAISQSIVEGREGTLASTPLSNSTRGPSPPSAVAREHAAFKEAAAPAEAHAPKERRRWQSFRRVSRLPLPSREQRREPVH